MTTLTVRELPIIDRGPMMLELLQLEREDVKSKAYQQTPIGRHVKDYLASIAYWDASENTVSAYEGVLARLALSYPAMELAEFEPPAGTDTLRLFLAAHWGDCAPETRRRNLSAVKSFCKWNTEEGRLTANPAARIRGPRRKATERPTQPLSLLKQLVDGQDTLRDQCCLRLLCQLGLRKSELSSCRVRDIDLVHGLILVHGKGGTDLILPLAFPDLKTALHDHIAWDNRRRDEFLLYPRQAKHRRMDPSSVHRWFKRCLERAGVEDFTMHEVRHSAADALWRSTGNPVLAQQLLRHTSLETTRRYLHPNRDDLTAGLLTLAADWKETS